MADIWSSNTPESQYMQMNAHWIGNVITTNGFLFSAGLFQSAFNIWTKVMNGFNKRIGLLFKIDRHPFTYETKDTRQFTYNHKTSTII